MLKEFRAFILRGNVLDLAVAVVIGASFGKIVTSLVSDIIMPPIGLVLGKVDFGNLYINLSGTPYPSLADAQAAGAATLNYGAFINTVVDFVLVAAVIFMLIRVSKRAQAGRAEQPAPATTKDCPFCLSSIPIKATRCAFCTSQL
jgi:large conductance mechanosensitive channel